MKLSTPLFLLSLLPIVAVQSEVIIGLRTVLLNPTSTEIAAANQPMKAAMADVQPELAAISVTPRNLQGADRRALRGNRDLQSTWCKNTCTGFPFGSCWVSCWLPGLIESRQYCCTSIYLYTHHFGFHLIRFCSVRWASPVARVVAGESWRPCLKKKWSSSVKTNATDTCKTLTCARRPSLPS